MKTKRTTLKTKKATGQIVKEPADCKHEHWTVQVGNSVTVCADCGRMADEIETTEAPEWDSFASPTSSHIKAACYNPTLMYLDITFHNAIYRYRGVPLDIWEQFKAADSKGKCFHASIGGRYVDNKIAVVGQK